MPEAFESEYEEEPPEVATPSPHIAGMTDYPMVFERGCQPKPAFDAVVKAARGKG